jgi:heme/copper-type cytochrome/quinol oxidase subunit 1
VPSITKKNLGNTLGLIHIGLTVIGGFGIALLFTYLGFAGFIRREANNIPFMWMLFALTVGIGQNNICIQLLSHLEEEEADNWKIMGYIYRA